jgi:hypothetical protein
MTLQPPLQPSVRVYTKTRTWQQSIHNCFYYSFHRRCTSPMNHVNRHVREFLQVFSTELRRSSGLSEDAEVGDPVGASFGVVNNKGFVVYSIDSITATGGVNGELPKDFFKISSDGTTGTLYVNSVVDKFIGSYITVKIRATTSFNQTATASVLVNFVDNTIDVNSNVLRISVLKESWICVQFLMRCSETDDSFYGTTFVGYC